MTNKLAPERTGTQPKATAHPSITGAQTPGGRAPSAQQPRILACRIDALYLAYAVTLNEEVHAQVEASHQRRATSTLLTAGPFHFELKASSSSNYFRFDNADLWGCYKRFDRSGWQLELRPRGILFADAHPLHVLDLLDRVAKAFGAKTTQSRVRRFDLAVDLTGFPILDDDRARVITRARGRNALFKLSSDPKGKPRALKIGRGEVSASIYDKSSQLRDKKKKKKKRTRKAEHARWFAGGWDGQSPVTRVEFRHRGRAINQLDAGDPRKLNANLNAIWQYDTRKWMRLIDPRSHTRRERCALDPRWAVVQAADFGSLSPTGPLKRHRSHGLGGASVATVLGTQRSLLAAAGLLPHIRPDDTAADFDKNAPARTATPAQRVSDYLSCMFRLAEEYCRQQLFYAHGSWEKARELLLVKHNAVAARYATLSSAATSRTNSGPRLRTRRQPQNRSRAAPPVAAEPSDNNPTHKPPAVWKGRLRIRKNARGP